MSNKSIFYDQKSTLTVKETVVLAFWCGPGYIACRKMACRKMNEDVAYARNTESGCKSANLNFRSLSSRGPRPGHDSITFFSCSGRFQSLSWWRISNPRTLITSDASRFVFHVISCEMSTSTFKSWGDADNGNFKKLLNTRTTTTVALFFPGVAFGEQQLIK